MAETWRAAERVVVTGAAQGIGLAIAHRLAGAGVDVALLDLDEDRTRAARDEVAAASPRVAVGHATCDVRDPDSVASASSRLAGEWGEADGLVNNAGIVSNVPAEEVTPDDWRRVVDVNLNGVFFCSQVFGRPMLAAGRGAIVSIASMSGLVVNRPQPQASYNASKAAVIMLTKCLAAEWAPKVRVNAVAPGYIRTAMTAQRLETEEARRDWIGATPLGRPGEPEEVADAVAYLLGAGSTFVTGSTLVIDGGYTAW